MADRSFKVYGDNVVECVRALDYITAALDELVIDTRGPCRSVTCPVYIIRTSQDDLTFRFLPGYGERRWDSDVLSYIKRSGGRLREAADAFVTEVLPEGERPLLAIEFCGALPAGNQAWQRQGRAFSFAHARIPFFYVAELGGFELGADRERRAERMPNPAIPFSFLTMTHYQQSVCLPVYQPNSGATPETVGRYGPFFGTSEFLSFVRASILDIDSAPPAQSLSDKCVELVKSLADAKRRQDGLTSQQWDAAYRATIAGQNLPDFLVNHARLGWRKTAYIDGLTDTARLFMDIGANHSFGLTSSTLPLSFVPKDRRARFAAETRRLYPDLPDYVMRWIAGSDTHLAIAWVMGFKPGGDDARPDRGLPPLARMLVGDDCDLMTFVYGPAPRSHWLGLSRNPVALATSNGLWEAVLGVSDAVLVDSATTPDGAERAFLKDHWAAVLREEIAPLNVTPHVRSLGEQDVDTALHVAFESLGADVVFEGMCNPPGGDWSGISFRWDSTEPEHRWLTLPRVSADGAKRPDHVFALFGHQGQTVCLCIESKELSRSLDADIGPRLNRYTEALFEGSPSIHRDEKGAPWTIYDLPWDRRGISFLSAGAYLSTAADPFRGLPLGTGLDMQIGVAFSDEGQRCTLHLRGDTDSGRALVDFLVSMPAWCEMVEVRANS